ncbi:patatin-like phospholipase family protein [Aureivirga marina]|uniref:patatin-like phospholipase family protein n=1 Tax=Aureivirga marina TaxID=1182451 RepID=UPI0018CB864A|nr:patatin-like phospholipase family protein [Aureivirga marina]
MKKALVISGGGAKGAFAGGIAEYLIKNQKKDYDMFIGSSTGSLLVTHLALGKLAEIKELYTNVTQDSIFNNCPFKIRKIHGHDNIQVNIWTLLWSLIKREKTFGQSLNLKRLIRNSISHEDYQQIKDSDHEIYITVSNFTEKKIEFKKLHDYSYDDYCDWVWASCNLVPFMSLLEKDRKQYADGSFGSIIPIRKAIMEGAKEIDIIVLDTEEMQYNQLTATNAFTVLFQAFDFMIYNLEQRDIAIGKLRAEHADIKLNFYYTPQVLTLNPLIFKKDQMEKWWSKGYKYAQKYHDF